MLSNNHTTLYLKCKDYLVSGEVFDLLYDAELDMLLTHPKPSKEELGKYYESEDYISHTDSKGTFLDKIYHRLDDLLAPIAFSFWLRHYVFEIKTLA